MNQVIKQWVQRAGTSLEQNIPELLKNLIWMNSMKWGDNNLLWGRPLKSILAIFDCDIDDLIKKNRLELLQLLCKTFDNYLNFSKVENL